jgi:ADP-heptose:LPS heptosyltransferase
MRRLILNSFQSPGDILMMTAAVRDLHAVCPGQFQTDVRTAADDLWLNNPHVTRLNEGAQGVETVKMEYPLVHQSNQRPYHFIHGYSQFLEQHLKVRIPVTRFHGDVHLSDQEKKAPVPGKVLGVPDSFWIVIAGGKNDFTAKWWNPDSYQKVVDHFRGRIQFVQCGEQGHWHPRLTGVIDLVGKTSLRDFVRLMHHADGVLCPVTFAMHLAAAVDTRPGKPKKRPCVVVAGGREPPHWEAYPHHQFISTIGALSCCAEGGCWRSRCQLIGDGDDKDRRNVCEMPVQVSPELRIPRCMNMITPEDVIRRIEMYFEGTKPWKPAPENVVRSNGHATSKPPPIKTEAPMQKISVSFFHGLGDCAHFAHLIPLYTRRGFQVEVECTPDKRILFESAGAAITSRAAHSHPWGYPIGATHSGHGRMWQGSKPGHNISEVPLPNIGGKDALWQEYCECKVDIASHLPRGAMETVERWLAKLLRPIILLHTKGNTGQERKSLPDHLALEFYRSLLDRTDGTIILLDWDNRVPRLGSYRIRHLTDLGGCTTDLLLALLTKADLLIGVDSGPLHVARFTDCPCLGIWMPGGYPSTYSVPRRQQLNVVAADPTQQWNKYKRIPWRIVEHPGSAFEPARLAELAASMLRPPVYFHADEIAADVQFQGFISKCRGAIDNGLSSFADRHRSFDMFFKEMARRFPSPTVVETGSIRAEEDWGGAGFFTYLAGAFLLRHGGTLHCVDIDQHHCQFARTWTEVFGNTVKVSQDDSVAYLGRFPSPIDVLYLDSCDTTVPGHADHALRELEAALPKLHDKSLILVDDTPWNAGAFVGKGARVVPWLTERGWKIIYGGYQVLMSK